MWGRSLWLVGGVLALVAPAGAVARRPAVATPRQAQASAMWWIPVDVSCRNALGTCGGRMLLYEKQRLIARAFISDVRPGRPKTAVFMVEPRFQQRFQAAGRVRLTLRAVFAARSGVTRLRRPITVVAPRGGDPKRGWFSMSAISGRSTLEWTYREDWNDTGCMNSIDAGGRDTWVYKLTPARARAFAFTGIDIIDVRFGTTEHGPLSLTTAEAVDGHDVTVRSGDCDPAREPAREESDRSGCGTYTLKLDDVKDIDWDVDGPSRARPGKTARLRFTRPSYDDDFKCPGPRDWQTTSSGSGIMRLRGVLSGDAAETVAAGPAAALDFDDLLANTPIGASRTIVLSSSGEWPLPSHGDTPAGTARLNERLEFKLTRVPPRRDETDGSDHYWPFERPPPTDAGPLARFRAVSGPASGPSSPSFGNDADTCGRAMPTAASRGPWTR